MKRIGIVFLVGFLIVAAGIVVWFLWNRQEVTPPQNQVQVVQVFFPNSTKDPEMMDCKKNYPVSRIIPASADKIRGALEEMLKGPTPAEKSQGYFSSINSGVQIQQFSVQNGKAHVDFDEQLEYQAGGSCRVASIFSQIMNTLQQFPEVNDTLISINGKTEDILQP